MAWTSISELAEQVKGVITANGIKQAASRNRVAARKNIHNRWEVNTDDPTVAGWIAQANAANKDDANTTGDAGQASTTVDASRVDELEAQVKELTEQLEKMKRENNLLTRRTVQAERAMSRAQKAQAKAEKELKERTEAYIERSDEHLQKMYQMSEVNRNHDDDLIMRVASVMARAIEGSKQNTPQVIEADYQKDDDE